MSYRYWAVLAWLAWAPTGAAEPIALEVGGLARRAEIHAPAGGEGTRPLVIALHGLRQPVENLRGNLGLDALADRERFVVAYPNGIERRWNYGRQLVAAIPLLEGKQVDDIAFFRALIARLVAGDRVDPRRIYLLGVSNGALMAYRAACEMGREIAAIAAFISPMSDLQQEDCPPGSPIPLFILAGNADLAQSYLGASGTLQGRLVSVPDTVGFFRARYGCTGVRSEELPHRDPLDRTTITLFRPQACPGGAEIVFYRVNGGGHRVPTLASGNYEPHPQFGLANRDIDSAAEAWAFFRRFVRN